MAALSRTDTAVLQTLAKRGALPVHELKKAHGANLLPSQDGARRTYRCDLGRLAYHQRRESETWDQGPRLKDLSMTNFYPPSAIPDSTAIN
jgi:hypothetical protein